MNYITKENIEGKKVLLRVDYNVPIKNGVILDDERIVKSLKTINFLLENNCRIIILSHLGKIKTKDDLKENSLKPVADHLGKLLNKEADFSNCIGSELLKKVGLMKDKDILVLENTRYCDLPVKMESSLNLSLAKYWASLGDVFVLDAFASLHRTHTSVAGISNYLPTYFGFLVKEEIENISSIINNNEHPFAVFMGGAKAEDKLKYIKGLLPKCDYLLVGGTIANTFLKALSFDIKDSLYANDSLILDEVRTIYNEYKEKIILPIDFVIDNNMILDLGEKTINKYIDILKNCKTIFINGSCGKFEDEKYASGTKKLLSSLKEIDAKKIAGGGDTLNAIKRFNMEDSFTYLSSGGGASLEYISFEKLDALDYILKK